MPHLPTLKTLMTPFPYAIDVEASLAQAQEMMTEHAIRHLPVALIGFRGLMLQCCPRIATHF